MHIKIFTFIFLGLFLCNTHGLRCYSCTLTVAEGEENPDLTCVNNIEDKTGKVKIIKCPTRMKYCTTVRNDYISTGGVASFERNCAVEPIISDGDYTGGDFDSHYRSCLDDLCNSGNGLETPGNGNSGGRVGIVIDGLPSSGNSVTASALTVLTLLLTKKILG